MEEWASALLADGRPDLALPLLRTQVAANPLWEGLVVQLVDTLQLVGRRAEALQVCRVTETRFAAELGVEPSAEFRRAHRALLEGATPEEPRHCIRLADGRPPPLLVDPAGTGLPEVRASPDTGVPGVYRPVSSGRHAAERSRAPARRTQRNPMSVLELQMLEPELSYLSPLVISCTSCSSNSCNKTTA